MKAELNTPKIERAVVLTMTETEARNLIRTLGPMCIGDYTARGVPPDVAEVTSSLYSALDAALS